MYWKMSIDLTRPQVSSMGAQDPLDGFVTLQRMKATNKKLGGPEGDKLEEEISRLKTMVDVSSTSDSLVRYSCID